VTRRHLQAFGHEVDAEDAFRAACQRDAAAHLSDRPESEHASVPPSGT